MTHHSIMSRLSTIISAALLLLPVSLHTHGQAVYSYNDTGACTSRTKPSTPMMAREAKDAPSARITVVDFPCFENTLTIKADSIPTATAPTCVLSDVDGMAVTTSPITNGTNTLDTSSLKSGVHFIKVYGLEQPFSCKVTKSQRL